MNKYQIMATIGTTIVYALLFGAPSIGFVRISIHSLHLVLITPIECVIPTVGQPKYCPK